MECAQTLPLSGFDTFSVPHVEKQHSTCDSVFFCSIVKENEQQHYQELSE